MGTTNVHHVVPSLRMATLTGLRLPLPWDEFDLPNPLQTATTVLMTGETAWEWDDAPDVAIPSIVSSPGDRAAGWDLDHVVLLVPDLATATAAMEHIEQPARLVMEVGGRPAAFFRVGPLLEVIESPVREAVIYGVALSTEEPLETVALRWRALGRDVTDPKPAAQPGRRIMTVRATEAGLAVMSPDRAAV